MKLSVAGRLCEALGRALRDVRIEQDINGVDLAERVAVSAPLLYAIERGEAVPSSLTLLSLAHALYPDIDPFDALTQIITRAKRILAITDSSVPQRSPMTSRRTRPKNERARATEATVAPSKSTMVS